MKILLNFLPVYTGGGLQNAVNFWLACLKYDKINQWICIARKESKITNLPIDKNHKIIGIDLSTNYFKRLISDNKNINHYAKKYNIDVIFTLVGPGPLTRKYIKVNGWHEPAFVYPDSIYWKKVDFKTKFLQKLKYIYADYVLKKTDYISVQTETMKKRMVKYRNIDENKLMIVPNGITSFNNEKYISKKHIRYFNYYKDKIKLLVLSEPWIHKNFSYLIEVAQLLNDNYIFFISFDKNTNNLSSNFIDKVKKLNLNKKFAFIGRVEHNEIKEVYNNIDAVFLPTLLESFSANYIEAMYYKKPIFTSDLDFAKEVCKDYAFYFDPLDPHKGYNILVEFFEKNNLKKKFEQIKKVFNINYPNWEERFKLYMTIIDKAYNQNSKYVQK